MGRLLEIARDVARRRPWVAALVVSVAIVGLAAGVFLISPYFIRYSLVEDDPIGDIVQATAEPETTTADPTVAAEATMAEAASMKMPTVEETPMVAGLQAAMQMPGL